MQIMPACHLHTGSDLQWIKVNKLQLYVPKLKPKNKLISKPYLDSSKKGQNRSIGEIPLNLDKCWLERRHTKLNRQLTVGTTYTGIWWIFNHSLSWTWTRYAITDSIQKFLAELVWSLLCNQIRCSYLSQLAFKSESYHLRMTKYNWHTNKWHIWRSAWEQSQFSDSQAAAIAQLVAKRSFKKACCVVSKSVQNSWYLYIAGC